MLIRLYHRLCRVHCDAELQVLVMEGQDHTLVSGWMYNDVMQWHHTLHTTCTSNVYLSPTHLSFSIHSNRGSFFYRHGRIEQKSYPVTVVICQHLVTPYSDLGEGDTWQWVHIILLILYMYGAELGTHVDHVITINGRHVSAPPPYMYK